MELAATLLYCGKRSSLSAGSRSGGCSFRRAGQRNHRAGPASSRAARRSAARLSRRRRAALRHSDGHWWLSRHAPPSPLRADHSGLHGAARLRNACTMAMRRDWPKRAFWPTTRQRSTQRRAASARIAAGAAPEAAESALYLLPLATRIRCLFKMDFAEAQYISELRSGTRRHFSYRRVAWEMYRGSSGNIPRWQSISA